MVSFFDLRDFFQRSGYKVIIAADGETKQHIKKNGDLSIQNVPGGVASSFDILAQASNATYIARARTEEDQLAVDKKGKVIVHGEEGDYTLKRILLSEEEVDNYYFGFSNQTLWPLSHVAFEKPAFHKEWYEGYKTVNQKFAKAIKEEISGKTFIWIHDYQLALVPLYLNLSQRKDVIVSFFWHIPWPTWEQFRILPVKKDILWSLLSCDFLAFHRGYQARNFLNTVQRELAVMIDEEKRQVLFDQNKTTVRNLPLGIDVDVIKRLVAPPVEEPLVMRALREMLQGEEAQTGKEEKKDPLDKFFKNYKVILGVDRLDYTKGVPLRLQAIDTFLTKYPEYREEVVYLGIMSPSRSKIPSYQALKKEVDALARTINDKYKTATWRPIQIIHQSFIREDVMSLYKRASLCLVTPLDDGMNLVSKEFTIAQSFSEDPGMLVLSQFAGSAIDLRSALIVNPYDVEQVADAIKTGLELPVKDKMRDVKEMVETMEERSIYAWAQDFFKEAIEAAKENKRA
jgi:trehalose 6-phosphate synthase/phosphatase